MDKKYDNLYKEYLEYTLEQLSKMKEELENDKQYMQDAYNAKSTSSLQRNDFDSDINDDEERLRVIDDVISKKTRA